MEWYIIIHSDLVTHTFYKGVAIPSQIRYIRYYESILQNNGVIPPPKKLKFLTLRMCTIPSNFKGDLYAEIFQDEKEVFTTPVTVRKVLEILLDLQ
jgi:hypothetical protein